MNFNSNIKWHKYSEDKPRKSGCYLVLVNIDSICEAIAGEGLLHILEYVAGHDLWNAFIDYEGQLHGSAAINGVRYWATIEDIQEGHE